LAGHLESDGPGLRERFLVEHALRGPFGVRRLGTKLVAEFPEQTVEQAIDRRLAFARGGDAGLLGQAGRVVSDLALRVDCLLNQAHRDLDVGQNLVDVERSREATEFNRGTAGREVAKVEQMVAIADGLAAIAKIAIAAERAIGFLDRLAKMAALAVLRAGHGIEGLFIAGDKANQLSKGPG